MMRLCFTTFLLLGALFVVPGAVADPLPLSTPEEELPRPHTGQSEVDDLLNQAYRLASETLGEMPHLNCIKVSIRNWVIDPTDLTESEVVPIDGGYVIDVYAPAKWLRMVVRSQCGV